MVLRRKLQEKLEGAKPKKNSANVEVKEPTTPLKHKKPEPIESPEDTRIKKEKEEKARKRREEERSRKQREKEQEKQRIQHLEEKIKNLEHAIESVYKKQVQTQTFGNLEDRVREILQREYPKSSIDDIIKKLVAVRPEDLRETMSVLGFTEKQIKRSCVRTHKKGTSQGKSYRDTEDMIRIFIEYLKNNILE